MRISQYWLYIAYKKAVDVYSPAMDPTPRETLAWIARRFRNGCDDELLDWSREDVERELGAVLPFELIAEALAALEERRSQNDAAFSLR